MLLFFNCKIGDFKIAGRVCLQKKLFVAFSLTRYFLVIFKILHWKQTRWQCTCNIVYKGQLKKKWYFLDYFRPLPLSCVIFLYPTLLNMCWIIIPPPFLTKNCHQKEFFQTGLTKNGLDWWITWMVANLFMKKLIIFCAWICQICPPLFLHLNTCF